MFACRRAPAPASAAPARALLLLLCLQLLPIRVLCVTWTAVEAGSEAVHTCGLLAEAGADPADGGGRDLYCWGYNYYGELGLGYANTSYPGCDCVPSIPPARLLSDVSSVALGGFHTCALFSNVSMACWGNNESGQLGLGSNASTVSIPTLVPSLAGVIANAAGTWHTCAVKSGGALYCWGWNQSGELGIGEADYAPHPVPLLVGGISHVTAVNCGEYHTCALTSSGGVYCWGDNQYGQLGDGNTTDLYSPPVIPILSSIAAVAAGGYHTCALTSAGGVYCWGSNYNGQLGLGYVNSTGCECVATPPASPVMTGVAQISAGLGHTCALKSGGVYCWGSNSKGQLGNGRAKGGANVLSPPSSPVLTGVAAITTGELHTCALMTGGGIECWGDNSAGQLGNGNTNEVDSPPSPTPTPSITPSPASLSLTPSTSATVSVTPTVSSSTSFSSTLSTTPSLSPTVSTTPTTALATGTVSATPVTASLSPLISVISTASASESPPATTAISVTPSCTPTVPPKSPASSSTLMIGAAVGGGVGCLLLLVGLYRCRKHRAGRRGDTAKPQAPVDGQYTLMMDPPGPAASVALSRLGQASVPSPLPAMTAGGSSSRAPRLSRRERGQERTRTERQTKLEQEAFMLNTSATAASFHYTAVLGAGCNGAVALATCTIPLHPFPTKQYAVKLIFNFSNLSTESRRNQYMAEFLLLAALPLHPGIVRLYCRLDDEVPGELLELLPAETRELISVDMYGRQRDRISTTLAVFEAHPQTLLEYRKTGARVLSYASFTTFARQLLDALLFLEENGVQHRDLKPDNIMVKEDGSLCIIDFGEAARFPDPAELQMIVPQGEGVIGNQAHIAPEVLSALATLSRGARSVEVNFRGQAVFEAGVLLFELAVCTHPLGDYPKAYASRGGTVVYPAEVVCVLPAAVEAEMVTAGYPSGFVALIGRMVAFEAAQRPSLREAADELAATFGSPL